MFYFVSHARNVSACWSVYSVGLGLSVTFNIYLEEIWRHF